MRVYAVDINAAQRETLGLTATEEGVLTRLRLWYLWTERPLPDDWRWIYAIAGVDQSAPYAERQAVANVVQRFFVYVKRDGGHVWVRREYDDLIAASHAAATGQRTGGADDANSA